MLARKIGNGLHQPLVQFLAPSLNPALFLIKTVALNRHALQYRGANGFLLAQARQFLAQFIARPQFLGSRPRVLRQHARGFIKC